MRRPVWDYIIHIYPKQDLSIFAPFRVLFSIFALIFAPPQKFCKKFCACSKTHFIFRILGGGAAKKTKKKYKVNFLQVIKGRSWGDHRSIDRPIDRSIDRSMEISVAGNRQVLEDAVHRRHFQVDGIFQDLQI